MPMIDHRQVRQQAQGKWDSILWSLCPNLRDAISRRGKAHCPCPVHGGKDGFRIFGKDFPEKGGVVCNTCGTFNNGIEAIMWSQSMSFYESLTLVAEFLGMTNSSATHTKRPAAPPMPVRVSALSDPERDEKSRLALRKAWKESKPLIAGDIHAEVVKSYFRNRGLSLTPATVRVHPNMEYREENRKVGEYVTMLATITAPDGAAVTLHRTYLDVSGKKAAVSAPKKVMSYPQGNGQSLTGGAIRLFDVQGTSMAVAEGIETSVAVTQATGVACWAASNAHMLETFEPPVGIKLLHIFADRDVPTSKHPEGIGKAAAVKLAQRLQGRGVSSIIHEPLYGKPGEAMDWLDVLKDFGATYFPKIK